MSKLDSSSEVAKRCRPFGLLDGMLLIAAVGLWLAGLNIWLAINTGWIPDLPESHGSDPILFSHDFYGAVAGVLIGYNKGILYFLAVFLLTGFYLCVRLRRPHPPWRQMMGQPGVMTCCMTPIAILVAQCFGESSFEAIPAIPPTGMAMRSYIVSAILACAWLTGCLSWRSNIEAGWIERLGRLMGVGWVGIGLVNFVM